MSSPDYREQYLKEVKDSEPAEAKRSGGPTSEAAGLIEVLNDLESSREERLAALARLQTLSFAVEEFRPFLGDYLEALRGVATESDQVLRARALEILALRRDEYAQGLLLDGLERKSSRLVPDRKALKLLGYDQHAVPRTVLVDLVDSSDAVLRRQALRQLAADGESVSIFERIVSDPSEDEESRRIGLTALQSLEPTKFERFAREFAMDENAEDELRAASITALAEEKRVGKAVNVDDELRQAVEEAREKTRSPGLTRAADDLLEAMGSG
jgi:hypothetical protein